MDIASAKTDLDVLQGMGVEEIRAKLLDEDGYALSRVRAIAATLGIGGTEKLSRGVARIPDHNEDRELSGL